MKSITLYLIGKPGVGKYTIARYIAEEHNFIVCDNHLINNPIFSLLSHKDGVSVSQYAWDCIGKIRNVVLDFMSHENTDSNLILTNYLDGNDLNTYNQILEMSAKRGSIFVPIQLTLRQDEHLKRITNPQRQVRYKSTDIKYINAPTLDMSHPDIVHPNLLILDTSDLSAQKASDVIMQHINHSTLCV